MPNDKQTDKSLRFAIYTRYSSEMQNDLSLEAQETYCREAIKKRGGIVVEVFKDSAKSGWSLDRDGFKALKAAAEQRKFDAVMFWKFDRLARNHTDSVMIKILMRHEYGLKLYCVEGFSEDDDTSPYTAMMEQMLAVFAAFYSKNLSSETKRGKRQRAINGHFNGSAAPIGYRLVTQSKSSPTSPPGLYIDARLAAIVRRAFRHYETGKYSDSDIATWMNKQPSVPKLRQNRQPMNKETVRDMLQNRVYTGRVPYTDTIYKGTLGEKRAANGNRSEWFEGKHEAIISDELFDACQAIRSGFVRHRHASNKDRIYVLSDRVFCARCLFLKPRSLVDDNFGKMRPKFHNQRGYAYFHCLSHDRGYQRCGQSAVPEPSINQQVVEFLSTVQIPEGFRERVETAVQERVENEAALEHMKEISEIVERLDIRWDHGFVSKEDYLEKRKQLQLELNALRPIQYEKLIEAADLLSQFKVYWDKCEVVNEPQIARQQLISKIVERVFVHEKEVVAIVLPGDFAVVLGEKEIASTQLGEAIAHFITNS
jgi:site-specific DNA recombinase